MSFWLLNTPDELWRLLTIVAANILFWVFLWGKKQGRSNQRLDTVEKRLDQPVMLKECQELFGEIREKLGVCIGQLQIISTDLKVNAKGDEKKHFHK